MLHSSNSIIASFAPSSQSVQDADAKAEKDKFDRMSIEEKAALKRQARRTAQKKTGGISDFLDQGTIDEKDVAAKAVRVKMTSNNLNTYKNSHTGIAKSMAGRTPGLAPLSRAIIDYEGEMFVNPDDMTLLANDDFQVNDMVRNTAVPSMEVRTRSERQGLARGANSEATKRCECLYLQHRSNAMNSPCFGRRLFPLSQLHTEGAKYFAKDGKKKGARFHGDTGHDEARMPRNTIMDKFKRAILLTKNVEKIVPSEDDAEGIVRRPRKSRMTRVAGAAGDVATDATLRAGGVAVKATTKVGGLGIRLIARATRMAAKAASPHMKKGGSAMASLTMLAIDHATGERGPRLTRDQRKQVSANINAFARS